MGNDNIQSFLELYSYKIQSFSQTDILSMIDPATLQDIKEKDQHPFFQLYSIMHEGISNSKLLNNISKPIIWTKTAIQSVKNVIKKGLKLFFRHNKDNSTENRKEIGEVVAHEQKEIDGKLHQLVVTYHNPLVRDEAKKCDVCSHEGNWNLIDKGKTYLANVIEDLTGIALSQSSIEKPAFEGTKRLAIVQSFENKLNEDTNMSDETKKEDHTNEVRDIRQKIKDLKIYPWQVFNVNELQNDRQFSNMDEVKGLFEDYANQKSMAIDLKKQLDDSMKKTTDLETNNKELLKKQQLIDAKGRLKTIIESKKLTEKQTEFVNNRFKEDLDDLSDDGLGKFIDGEIDNFKDFAKYYESNLNIETNTQEGDKTDKTKAANNPLIDED